MTQQERFWSKVEKTSTCWLWRGVIARDGYGHVTIRRKQKLAHRVAYECTVGKIAAGMTLDHLCRVRNCVNPEHLEPVTMQENTLRSPVAPAAINARKTHCPQGHRYAGANLRVGSGGRRYCRTCQRDWMRAKRAGKKFRRIGVSSTPGCTAVSPAAKG